nr:MauE/DoxX family redox-associated membrane protein [uncultured Dyadobacter sp.]
MTTATLAMLYFYTAISKMLDYTAFRGQMLNQAFPSWVAHLLIWLLPPAELLAVLLLTTQSLRPAGMWLSTLMMSAFTVYIGLVLIDFYDRTPCSCGGVVSQLSFQGHFVFNLFFLALSILGVMLARTGAPSQNTNKPQAGTGRTPAPLAPGSAENLETE